MRGLITVFLLVCSASVVAQTAEASREERIVELRRQLDNGSVKMSAAERMEKTRELVNAVVEQAGEHHPAIDIDIDGWRERLRELAELRAARASDTTFVGTFVELGRVERVCGDAVDPETGKEVWIHCDSDEWEIKYRVEKVIQGDMHPGDLVAVREWTRNGKPKFTDSRNALVMLDPENLPWISKLEVVYPVGGSFASCGCRKDSEGTSHCQTIDFDPPITVDLRNASRLVIDRYKNDKVYSVRRDEAICVQGEHLDSLHNSLIKELIEYDTSEIARGCGLIESPLCPADLDPRPGAAGL